MVWNDEKIVKTLLENVVVVMPTDTIYGIVGRAQNESVVNRVYKIRKRNPSKPCIILIGNIGELKKFSINLSEEQKNKLKEYWHIPSKVEGFENSPPVSIVLECTNEKFAYLHRGTQALAFRLPAKKDLINLLLRVGPLIAPSANIEGLNPSINIKEAQDYFGNQVDLYVDGGEIVGKASKIVKLNKDGSTNVLRE